jgi:hypothetical protein
MKRKDNNSKGKKFGGTGSGTGQVQGNKKLKVEAENYEQR